MFTDGEKGLELGCNIFYISPAYFIKMPWWIYACYFAAKSLSII